MFSWGGWKLLNKFGICINGLAFESAPKSFFSFHKGFQGKRGDFEIN
jgi:hypothetical protein